MSSTSDIAGEFIVMAANLLYIKSRTLLPKDQQMAEEDADEDDPRWELIRQLIEYKKFKEAASHLRTREAMQEQLFPRFPAMPEIVPSGNLLIEEVGIFDLINAFQKILKRLESSKHHEDLREIFEENFTVSDKIDFLLRVISEGVPVRFEECFADAASRAEIVVTFLAMLELIRLNQLRVRQENHFEEIWIERAVLAAPASIGEAPMSEETLVPETRGGGHPLCVAKARLDERSSGHTKERRGVGQRRFQHCRIRRNQRRRQFAPQLTSSESNAPTRLAPTSCAKVQPVGSSLPNRHLLPGCGSSSRITVRRD